MKKSKNKRPRILISGYYGFGSIGDEAVLRSVLQSIAQELPNCHVTVLTNNKKSVPKIDNVKTSAVGRYNLFALIPTMLLADLFISGGGTLLQDGTSRRSLTYYTSLITLAKLCGCKIFIFANGIGPVEDTEKCKKALLSADVISLRDPDSYSLVKMLVPKKQDVFLTADPVFSPINTVKPSPFLACLYIVGDRPYFAVSVRKCCGEKNIDTEKLLFGINYAVSLGFVPVFVSMQDCFDLELSRYLAKKTNGIVADVRDENDLIRLLDGASFAIGMRLHFLLFAAMRSIPVIPLSYDRKVESCLRYMGITNIADAFDFSLEEIRSMIEDAIDHKNPSSEISKRRDRLANLALRDSHFILSLILPQREDIPKERERMEEVSG